MTLNPGKVGQGIPDPALLQLCAFLLEQLGGSIALSLEEQHRIFNGNKTIESYQLTDPYSFVLKVVNNDQQRNI